MNNSDKTQSETETDNPSAGSVVKPTEEDSKALQNEAVNTDQLDDDTEANQPNFTQSPSMDLSYTLSWTAPEFISHEKPLQWYPLLLLGGVLLAAILYLIIRDIVSVIMVFIAIALLGIYGLRKPKDTQYRLDTEGVNIGDKYFSYDHFRSFTATTE